MALYAIAIVAVSAAVLTFLAAVVSNVDLRQMGGPLVVLCLMLGVLYWTTTLLPGPIKKVGKAAGRGIVRMVNGRRERRH